MASSRGSVSSVAGSRFPGISLPTVTSFMSPNVSSIMQPVKYGSSNWCRQVKLEQVEYGSPHSVPPVTNEHFLLKPCGPLFGMEKQFSFLHGTGVDIAPKSSFTEYNNHYPQNFTNTDCISRFRPWTKPSGSEDITVCDAVSTIHEESRASNSRSAFSLLSSHSQNLSTHSSAIFPTDQPLPIQGNHAHYNLDQFYEKLFGLSSQVSTSSVSNRFSSSVKYDGAEPIVASDASNSFNFDVQADGIFQGSEFVSTKDPLSQEDATTVNLLQLSSQLQRVEQQRHSIQVKEEDDTFFRLPFP